MTQHEITIVIPSIKALSESAIINSYMASPVRERVKVQFVYLQNLKHPTGNEQSTIEQFPTHELITVANPWFFTTADENIFRIQDFLPLLKPFIFVVGEHDAIDWPQLLEALVFREKNQLDVLGWNVLCREQWANGTEALNLSLIPLADDSVANHFIQRLFRGEVLPGVIGYAALYSIYGGLDWAAYIGNHLYSKAALSRLLQYSFSEYIYGQVYKQAVFFTEQNTRYGIYTEAVIHRFSNDFEKQRRGEKSWVSPRHANGASPIYWFVHLPCLYEIEDDALFCHLLFSLRLIQRPTEHGEVISERMANFPCVLKWMEEVLLFAVHGRSYYFPNKSATGMLRDVRQIMKLLIRIGHQFEKNPIFADLPPKALLLLQEALIKLASYLGELHADIELLSRAATTLAEMANQFTAPLLVALNKVTFDAYIRRHGMEELKRLAKATA